jgi:probable lipoprotein NlpC
MSPSKTTLLLFLLLALPFGNGCGLFKKTTEPDTRTSGTYSKVYTPEVIHKVVQSARLFIGTPYLYGGMTSRGIDCSGLMTLAFNSAGLKIPRASYDIAEVGREVKVKDVRKGDLLFFVTGSQRNKISHVGIVVDHKSPTNLTFVHAPNSGVREDNLFTPYYQKTFAKAMRPF